MGYRHFSCLTNLWLAKFHVDYLTLVDWSDTAFDDLVMPAGEKQLVWKLVEGKLTKKAAVDRPIIIHMFGPPGVGKTFAVEASK